MKKVSKYPVTFWGSFEKMRGGSASFWGLLRRCEGGLHLSGVYLKDARGVCIFRKTMVLLSKTAYFEKMRGGLHLSGVC